MASPRLEAAYTAQVKAIRARLVSFTQARYAAGQYRDDDLKVFLAAVVPVVIASRRQISSLTDAYLARILTEKLGRPIAPRGPIQTADLRGVDATEVYSRPFVTVRTKLSDGLTYDAAVSAGAARLNDLVVTDMQLAKTNTATSVFSETPGVTRYVRVLSGGNSCALCYLASTQTYATGDLMPIHPGCDCGVDPLTDDNSPDRDLVPAVHEAISDRLGVSDSSGRDVGLGDPAKDYSKLVIVHEHGEIGPVLSVRGDHFTGPSAIPS